MLKRIFLTILILITLLTLSSCAKAPEPEPLPPEYAPEVAAMLADFDPAAGTPQPYDLPPSYAPTEVWEAVWSAADSGRFDGVIYTTLYETGLTREDVARWRDDIMLVGGYQCWAFRSDEAVLGEEEDLFKAIRLTNDWCFVLFFNTTPICFVEYSASGLQQFKTWSRWELLRDAVCGFTSLYVEDTAESPVLLYLMGSEGENHQGERTLLAAVRTEEPGDAYVSSYGFTDSISLLRYERQRVQYTRRMTKQGVNILPNKRLPYWRSYTPPEDAPLPQGIFSGLALGFGVYLLLLFSATFGGEALRRRALRRKRQQPPALREAQMQRRAGRRRLGEQLFALVIAAALVLGVRYAILCALPQNRYLRERYGGDFHIAFFSGRPYYSRWPGLWLSGSSLPLGGTPDEELSTEGLTAKVTRGTQRVSFTLTNTGEEPKRPIYYLVEEQCRGGWFVCVMNDYAWDGETVRTLRAGKQPDLQGRQYLMSGNILPGHTRTLLVDVPGDWQIPWPYPATLRLILFFDDGGKYAVEFESIRSSR